MLNTQSLYSMYDDKLTQDMQSWLAETEEDKLEARTDGSDAFDVLCIGAETKPVFQGSGGTVNTYG